MIIETIKLIYYRNKITIKKIFEVYFIRKNSNNFLFILIFYTFYKFKKNTNFFFNLIKKNFIFNKTN